ncbi:MAG: acyltransferase [Acidimicrobiia bacterium]|nr:acyltransferase [Acidimicrobiia bacterium]
MTRGRRGFPACDGLRALAAGSVFFFHVATLTGLVARTGGGPYFFQLDVGVDVFFVLSGFLLYRPFARAHMDGGDDPQVGRYLKRRFLRIFPAYWVVLVAVLYVFHQATAPGTTDGLIFLSLTQIYSKQRVLGGLVPAWTLATEISFYAFLPLYAWVLRTCARRGAAGAPGANGATFPAELLGVAALYAGSCVFRIVASSRGDALAYNWLPSYLDVFALGMLLAVVSVAVERGVVGEWWQSVPRDAAVWWGAAVALFVAVSNLGMPLGLAEVSPGKFFVHHLMAGTIGLLLVCPAVLHEDAGGRIRAALASRPLRALGLISYGIYLWQVPWITQVIKWTGGKPFWADVWPVLLLSALLTLVSAWATYVVIERPLLASRSREQGGSGVAAAIPSATAAE